MTVLAVVTGFALALVLVLGWLVITLRRDVAGLSAQLAEGRSAAPTALLSDALPPPAPEPPPPPAPEAESEPRPAVRTVVSLDSRDEPTQPPEEAPGDALADAPGPVEEVPVITALADQVDDVDLTTRRVASVTLARPLIKMAALSYGVRRALDDEHRMRVRLTMRRELKRQRKMRRRRRAGRAPSQGWVP